MKLEGLWCYTNATLGYVFTLGIGPETIPVGAVLFINGCVNTVNVVWDCNTQ